jgi:antitoxin MazE
MTEAVVSRCGDALAICFPSEVAERTGLREGERVEIEVRNGDILVRRQSARAVGSGAATSNFFCR